MKVCNYENMKIYKYGNMQIYMKKKINMKNVKEYVKKVNIYIVEKALKSIINLIVMTDA